MATVAQALDDPRYIAGLRFTPMEAISLSLGQRLIAAVIPAYFKDPNALHLASRIAYSTIHKWKTGESNPRWEQVQAIAELVHVNPFRLLSGAESESTRPRIGDHPEWRGAVVAAQSRFPGRVPDHFYEIAGETAAAVIPEHLDEHFAFELASFWFKHANDHELTHADTSAARRELDALRESTKLPHK